MHQTQPAGQRGILSEAEPLLPGASSHTGTADRLRIARGRLAGSICARSVLKRNIVLGCPVLSLRQFFGRSTALTFNLSRWISRTRTRPQDGALRAHAVYINVVSLRTAPVPVLGPACCRAACASEPAFLLDRSRRWPGALAVSSAFLCRAWGGLKPCQHEKARFLATVKRGGNNCF